MLIQYIESLVLQVALKFIRWIIIVTSSIAIQYIESL